MLSAKTYVHRIIFNWLIYMNLSNKFCNPTLYTSEKRPFKRACLLIQSVRSSVKTCMKHNATKNNVVALFFFCFFATFNHNPLDKAFIYKKAILVKAILFCKQQHCYFFPLLQMRPQWCGSTYKRVDRIVKRMVYNFDFNFYAIEKMKSTICHSMSLGLPTLILDHT